MIRNTEATSLTSLKAFNQTHSLDVIWGIVLFGILLINGVGFAHVYGGSTISGGSTGWDLYNWITSNMLFEGTMRALFLLLFGIGMIILLYRLEKKFPGIEPVNIHFISLTCLLVFGFIHVYPLVWTGEILYDFAFIGFLVYSFKEMAPKTRIIGVVILFSLSSFWSYIEYTTYYDNTKN